MSGNPGVRTTPPAETKADAKIWRYLDFAKYAFMIRQRSLVFATPEKFEGDPYEGSFNQVDVDRLKNRVLARPKRADGLLAKAWLLSHINQDLRFGQVFVNCWHIGHHESDAMWRLYGGTRNCIAVQSTYGRLKRCLPKHVLLKRVVYKDTSKPTNLSDLLAPFVRKRLGFRHEKELRAIIHPNDGVKHGSDGLVHIRVDLTQLIERIYVSPLADGWFADMVKSQIDDQRLRIEVKPSALAIRRVDLYQRLLDSLDVKSHARTGCPTCGGGGVTFVQIRIDRKPEGLALPPQPTFCGSCDPVGKLRLAARAGNG